MLIFIIVAGGIILQFVYFQTKDEIARQISQRQEQMLSQLVPTSMYDNQPSKDIITIKPPDFIDSPSTELYLYKKNNQIIAMAMPVITKTGYSGEIRILAGIYLDGQTTNVRVIKHSETPGIGDIIDHRKSNWISQFGLKTIKPLIKWQLDKFGGNIDAVTGATVSTRAVTELVKTTVAFLEDSKGKILEKVKSPTKTATY